jgi:hypothetical protein
MIGSKAKVMKDLRAVGVEVGTDATDIDSFERSLQGCHQWQRCFEGSYVGVYQNTGAWKSRQMVAEHVFFDQRKSLRNVNGLVGMPFNGGGDYRCDQPSRCIWRSFIPIKRSLQRISITTW